MPNKSKNTTFRFGKNANVMLERKLIKNFIVYGKLTSTEKKVKFLKNSVEKIVSTAKKATQASRNQISKKISDKKVEALLNDFVVPAFKDKKTGFVKTIKLNIRKTDGSRMSRLEWSLPVVFDEKKKLEEKKAPKKTIKKSFNTKTIKKKTDKKVKSRK